MRVEDRQLLERLIRENESQWLDFKERMYKIHDPQSLYKYVSDVIAFANVARRTGRACYVVFGVKDRERRLVGGIETQYPGPTPPGFWRNPKVPLQVKFEETEKYLLRKAEEYIEPVPDMQLRWADINGRWIAALEVRPSPSKEPFALKKNIEIRREGKGPKIYRKGEKFFRLGSETRRVTPSLEHLLLIYQDVPYLEKKQWNALIDFHLREEFQQSFEWLQRFPLRGVSPDGKDRDAFAYLWELLHQGRRRIVLSGEAGVGKSMLMRALAYQVALEARDAPMYSPLIEEAPRAFVPLFFEMYGPFSEREFHIEMARQVVRWAHSRNIDKRLSLNQFFAIPGSRWVLFLDGLDEIHNWRDKLPWLQRWVENLPENVSVILAARPYIWPSGSWDLELRKLTPQEAFALTKLRLDEISILPDSEKKDFTQHLQNWLQDSIFQSVFDRPRSVDALLQKCQLVEQGKLLAELVDSTAEELSKEAKEQHDEAKVGFSNISRHNDVDNALPRYRPEQVVNEEESGDEEEEILPVQTKKWEEVAPLWQSLSSEALALDIVDYLWQEEESKHARFWGGVDLKTLSQARNNLERSAWRGKWDKITLWPDLLSEKEKFHCERIGFIAPDTQQKYIFSSLPKKWIAAAWGGFTEFQEVIEKDLLYHKCFYATILWKWLRSRASASCVMRLFYRVLEENGYSIPWIIRLITYDKGGAACLKSVPS